MTTIPLLLATLGSMPAHADPVPPPIIGGEAADVEDYPMTGAILLDADIDVGWGMPVFFCSSTLIAPDVVLTAAHCIDVDMLETYYLGTDQIRFYWTRQTDLSDYQGLEDQPLPADAVLGRAWVLHEGWQFEDLRPGLAVNDDIGLLVLDEAQWDLPTAVPADPEHDAPVTPGELVEVVGWGQQTADIPAPADAIGKKMAGTSMVLRIAETEFQLGRPDDPRQCFGDSGGPVLRRAASDGGDRLVVLGLASHTWDYHYCEVSGAVNTRIEAYADWIAEQLERACDEGLRPSCEPGAEEPADTGGPGEHEPAPADTGAGSSLPELLDETLGGSEPSPRPEPGCARACTTGGRSNGGGLLLVLGLVTWAGRRRRAAHPLSRSGGPARCAPTDAR